MGLVENEQESGARRLEDGGRRLRQDPEENVKVEMQTGSASYRIMELELENMRLTRLVAELMLKNQRLRESN